MTDIAYLPQPNVERRQTIAKNVKAHLAHAGVSASEMGRRIGMTQSKMSRRTTAAEPFDIDELGAIADELRVTVVDLITGQLPVNAVKHDDHNAITDMSQWLASRGQAVS